MINMEGIKIVRSNNDSNMSTAKSENASYLADALAFANPDAIMTLKSYFNMGYEDMIKSDTLNKVKAIYAHAKESEVELYDYLLKIGNKLGGRFKDNMLDRFFVYVNLQESKKSQEKRIKYMTQAQKERERLRNITKEIKILEK